MKRVVLIEYTAAGLERRNGVVWLCDRHSLASLLELADQLCPRLETLNTRGGERTQAYSYSLVSLFVGEPPAFLLDEQPRCPVCGASAGSVPDAA